jgi:putative transcriptional regulator
MTSLAPAFLLSMPQLMDRNFRKSVILLCSHNECGAFGLVVNRPLVTSGRVVVNLDPPVATERELEIWVGGPVEPHRSWMLVGGQSDAQGSNLVEGASKITEGLYLSTSPQLLRRMLEECPPPRTRLVAGYAGWRAGQLEAELEESSWLISEVDLGLIFDTPPEQMWETAIRKLGADPSALQASRGVH